MYETRQIFFKFSTIRAPTKYTCRACNNIDSFYYVLLFQIDLWIPGAGAGYTKVR